MLSYELGCLQQYRTCNGPGKSWRSDHGNIPDWKACSVLCFSKDDCLGWHYSAKGRLCRLYNICEPTASPNDDDVVGDRNCHAKRK